MALDLESLRYDAGMSSRNSSYSGIGREGGSKAWAETYDKIMNSKESVSFYLVAAQEHLDYNTAKEFAMSTAVENLRKERNILKILEPLRKSTSVEANRIYSQILDTLGLSTEGIGDKIKSTGKKIWRTIVEAFRKIKLAIVNIIQAIRRGLASFFNGGDTKKYVDNWSKIIGSLNGKGAANKGKTVKVQAVSTKQWIFPTSNNKKYEALLEALSRYGSQAASTLGNVVGHLDSPVQVIDRTIKELEAGWDSFQKSAGVKKTSNSLDPRNGGMAKGNPLLFILYGTTKPKEFDVSIHVILNHPAARTLIDNTTLEAAKLLTKSLDTIVNTITKLIKNIEDFISKTETVDSKSDTRAVMSLLKKAREVLNYVTLASRESFIQFIKLRKTVIKAASSALDNIDDKDYKDSKKGKKTW